MQNLTQFVPHFYDFLDNLWCRLQNTYYCSRFQSRCIIALQDDSNDDTPSEKTTGTSAR